MEEKNSIEVEKIKEDKPETKDKGPILKVKTDTSAKSLASAIQATQRNHGYAELRCIGDGAIGAAFRACIIASGPLKQIGVDLVMEGYYDTTVIDGEEKTVTVMVCGPR